MVNDLVYILCKSGSAWQDNEIRYSIRSAEMYLKDFGKIFIIGYKPDFLNENVIHIPHQDIYQNKARNIMAKIYRACSDHRVSENFMFFNDDYFCLKEFSAVNYPLYYKCDLHHSVKIQYNDYKKHCEATLKVLQEHELGILNFDVHYPIIYNKVKYKEMANSFNWNIPYGYISKSMYCNYHGITGEQRFDCKVSNAYSARQIPMLNEKREIFSTSDPSLNGAMREYIKGLFPNKSRYEL